MAAKDYRKSFAALSTTQSDGCSKDSCEKSDLPKGNITLIANTSLNLLKTSLSASLSSTSSSSSTFINITKRKSMSSSSLLSLNSSLEILDMAYDDQLDSPIIKEGRSSSLTHTNDDNWRSSWEIIDAASENVNTDKSDETDMIGSVQLSSPKYSYEKIKLHWDTLTFPHQSALSLSVFASVRIKDDLESFNSLHYEDIHISQDEADFSLVHVILIGPENTPYDGGFFYFTIRFPFDYPFQPPQVKFITTSEGPVLINPNLSIVLQLDLDITAGSSWTCTNSLTSVLQAIEDIMYKEPWNHQTESSNDIESGRPAAQRDEFVYQKLRDAVCDILEHPNQSESEIESGRPTAQRDEFVYQKLRVAVCDILEHPRGLPLSMEAMIRRKFVENYCKYHLQVIELIFLNKSSLWAGNSVEEASHFKFKNIQERLHRLWTEITDDLDPIVFK